MRFPSWPTRKSPPPKEYVFGHITPTFRSDTPGWTLYSQDGSVGIHRSVVPLHGGSDESRRWCGYDQVV